MAIKKERIAQIRWSIILPEPSFFQEGVGFIMFELRFKQCESMLEVASFD